MWGRFFPYYFLLQLFYSYLDEQEDFPDCLVNKNPPASAGDTGSVPGLGRSHTPHSS